MKIRDDNEKVIEMEFMPTSHAYMENGIAKVKTYNSEFYKYSYCQLIDSVSQYFSTKEKQYMADVKKLYKQLLPNTKDSYFLMKTPFQQEEGITYFYKVLPSDFEFPPTRVFGEFYSQIKSPKESFKIIKDFSSNIDSIISYLIANLPLFNEQKRQILNVDSLERKRYTEIIHTIIHFIYFIQDILSDKKLEKTINIVNANIETRQLPITIPVDMKSILSNNASVKTFSGAIATISEESRNYFRKEYLTEDDEGNLKWKQDRRITGIKCQKLLDYITHKHIVSGKNIIKITIDEAETIFNDTNTTRASQYVNDCNELLKGLTFSISDEEFFKGKKYELVSKGNIKILDTLETDENRFIWGYVLSGAYIDIVKNGNGRGMIPESAFSLSDEAYIILKNISIRQTIIDKIAEKNNFNEKEINAHSIQVLLNYACIEDNRKYTERTIMPLVKALNEIKPYFLHEFLKGKIPVKQKKKYYDNSFEILQEAEFLELQKKEKPNILVAFISKDNQSTNQIKGKD